MERFHRLFTNGNKSFKAFLDSQNIPHEYEESIVGETVFLLISESDPSWPLVSEYLKSFPIPHRIEARFSTNEIDGAAWCRLGATSHFGYPQPEDDFGYLKVTYENGGCSKCGIGYRQIAPFRFRKPPTMRRSQILQLNWVFDEFFVEQEARKQIEASELRGMEFEDVLLDKSGGLMQTWSQIRISQTLPPILVTNSLTVETCSLCSQIKFNHPMGEQINLAKSLNATTPDIVKSSEWFGSGGSAHQLVFVSQRFVQFFRANNWRGLHLEPVITPVAA